MAGSSDPLVFMTPDLAAARRQWLTHMKTERRLSPLSIDAYERDSRQFLHFLTDHLGEPAGIAAISGLRPADFRAFLAFRKKNGAGPRVCLMRVW